MNNFQYYFSFLLTDPPLLLWFFALGIGAIAGSFFNCVIYRVPRDISLVSPGSNCPVCKHKINPIYNIPIFSYIFLRGRCKYCKSHISWTYPAVEIITAIWFLVLFKWLIAQNLSGWNFANGIPVVFFFLFFIPITWIDIEHRIIPDSFTLPGIFIGILISFAPGGITPLQSFVGLLAGGLPLLTLGWIGEKVLKKGEAMGGGDIKLMAAIGALLGTKTVLLSLFFGSMFGAIAGIAVLLISKRKDHRISFGPYLCLGTVTAFFFGNQILNIYLNALVPG